MATHYLAPDPIQSTFFIPGGAVPGNGVQIFFYTNLSSTKTTVYKDSAGATPWSNPIVADSGGNLPSGGQVYIPAGITITVKYAPSNDTDPPGSVYRTLNDIVGVNDVSSVASQWTAGPAPTFVNTTTFTLVGDQTVEFQVGRRLKTTNTGGTIYSRISASAFTALTTITVVNDSGVLDSGLSAVSYGALSAVGSSIPAQRDNTFLLADGTDPTKTASFELSGVNSSTGVALSIPNTSGVLGFIVPQYISGMIQSVPTVSTVAISAGSTVDSSAAFNLKLSAAITKVITSSWSVSSNGGGLLDAGAVSTNIWYYGHAIANTTSRWIDIGWSSTNVAPSLPAGYSVKSNQPVAAIYEVANTTVAFDAYEIAGGGVSVRWRVPTQDFNLSNTLTTSRRTDAVKVPNKFSTVAHLSVYATDAASPWNVNISCPDVTDAAVVGGTATSNLTGDAAGRALNAVMSVPTSSTGTIAARADIATVDTYAATTLGFDWSRRN